MIKNKKRNLSALLVAILISTFLFGCSADIPSTEEPKITQETKNEITYEQKSLFTNLNKENIDEERIMNIIKDLASEKYAGRLPGTEGNRLSADYIINYYKKIGLVSPEELDDYKQYYKQTVTICNSAPILEIVDKDGNVINSYKYITQFSPGIGGINVIDGEVTAPVFYIDSSDEYVAENENLSGKIIALSKEVLNEVNSKIIKTGDKSDFDWIMSKENGVKGIIGEFGLRDPDSIRKYFAVSKSAVIDNSDKSKGLIQMACDSPQFNEIKREIENGAQVHMKVDYSVEEVEVPNIIGMIPAAVDNQKNEYIIITAHFDHVGDNKDGTYNPGALDNASGTAVMMELARVIKESGINPKKTILFIAFNGEEESCLGSKYYSENPIFPLDNAVIINMDMVGSRKAIPLSIADYEVEENKLKEDLKRYANQIDINARSELTPRSDHIYFNKKGIDAVSLMNLDESSGYHSPMDTLENINKQRIKKAAELVLFYVDRNAY